MKKYDEFEFEKDSSYGQLDLATDQYIRCINNMAKAEINIKKATNVHDQDEAWLEKNYEMAHKQKLEATISCLVGEIGDFGAASVFLNAKRRAMEAIVNNPSQKTAHENGLFNSDNQSTSSDDAATIKSMANESILGIDATMDYIEGLGLRYEHNYKD